MPTTYKLPESLIPLISEMLERSNTAVQKAIQLSDIIYKDLHRSGVLDSIAKNANTASKLMDTLSAFQKISAVPPELIQSSSSVATAFKSLASTSTSCKLKSLEGFPVKLDPSLLDAISVSDETTEKKDYIDLDLDTYNAINDNLVSIPKETPVDSDDFQFGQVKVRRDTFFFIISILITILASFPGWFSNDDPSQNLPQPTEIRQECPSPEEDPAPDDQTLFVAVQTSEIDND